MHKGRMEAFSDGVIAIILTIMVLEMKVPHGSSFETLLPMWPVFLSYILSFVHVGIYWNNHHHLCQAIESVNGRVLWANQHLLFWLSLIPFVTGWMGENHFESQPVALYGCVLLMCGVAYYVLTHQLLAHHSKNSALAQAIGDDFKGKISVGLYALAITSALFWSANVAVLVYAMTAAMWLIPDRRIEKKIGKR